MDKQQIIDGQLQAVLHADLQKKVALMEKKLKHYEALRLVSVVEKSARSTNLYFQNLKRSARIQGRFTIRG